MSGTTQGSVCLTGTTSAHLNTLFDSEPGGLVGADYQRAFPLGEGRVLWLFQDGAVRLPTGDITIVHSVAMVQDGPCFDVRYTGTRSDPRSFLFPDVTVQYRRWFWPLDAELGGDGRLYVFAVQMEERGEEYLSEVVPVATRVAVVDPATVAIISTPVPANPSPDLYGWSITSDARWTYLYAQCYRQFGYDLYIFTDAFDRLCSTEVTVGRVPRGELLAAPEYWDGARWQPDPGRAVSVIAGDGRRINANQIEFTGSSFFSVNKEGDWWGDTIYFARAESATGPFVVFDQMTAPVKCLDCNSFFAAWIPHDAATRPLSTFVFGLSHNRWDGEITSVYRPTFHTVPVPPQVAAGDAVAIEVGEAAAVVLNVTSTRSVDQGHIVAYPCAAGRPIAASLTHPAGVTTGGLAVVRPDVDGRVCFYTRSLTDLVADSFGRFDLGDGFEPLDRPARLADTRVDSTRLAAGDVLRVGVPNGSRTAALTITSVGSDAPGYVTAYACDRDRPLASTLNAAAGETVSNLALVRPSATGEVCLFSKVATDLVVDLVGGFGSDDAVVDDDIPTRIFDSRVNGGPIRGGRTVQIEVPGSPAAAVFNITAVRPGDVGYVTAYPCAASRPTASSLNYAAGVVRGNLAIVRPDDDGRICLFTRATTDLVVDLAGLLPAGSGFVAEEVPVRVLDSRAGIGVPG